MIYDTEKRSPTTHIWIFQDGEFKIHESNNHEIIHAAVFGIEAWSIKQRGYYEDKTGSVTCHCNLEQALEKRLEKFLEKEGLCPLFRRFKILDKETSDLYE